MNPMRTVCALAMILLATACQSATLPGGRHASHADMRPYGSPLDGIRQTTVDLNNDEHVTGVSTHSLTEMMAAKFKSAGINVQIRYGGPIHSGSGTKILSDMPGEPYTFVSVTTVKPLTGTASYLIKFCVLDTFTNQHTEQDVRAYAYVDEFMGALPATGGHTIERQLATMTDGFIRAWRIFNAKPRISAPHPRIKN